MTEKKDRKQPPARDLDKIFGPDPVVSGRGPDDDRDAEDREAWYRENRPPHHDPR